MTERTLPQVVIDPGMPSAVRIFEVGPRDGLQNESTVVDVQDKVAFIRRLRRAGLSAIEVTSFVHPRWVPQLADAEEVIAALAADDHDGVTMPVLVPNERGLDRARAAGVQHVGVFASATETFAQRNLNRSLDGQFDMIIPTVRSALADGMDVRGYVSMCFGDPWEGAVPLPQVVDAGMRLLDAGVSELSLGDTIGVGTPGHVTALLAAFTDAGADIGRIALHFHDTYGQALSNVQAGLRGGVTTFDASAGGLGGCPYALSATGNLATEDLVWMLDGLGIRHGADLGALVETSVWMASRLGRPAPSRVVAALGGG